VQGKFDSNVPGISAIIAEGTNGAGGVEASSDTGTAIKGVGGKVGILGGSPGGIAVAAIADQGGIGVRATSDRGWAINAQTGSGVAILGVSDDGVGVQGECQEGNNFGILGRGPNAGVAAFNSTNDHAAYLASECCAAWFTGGVTVTGPLTKGGGGFRIDHPLDPARRFLSHSFVESPDMKNVYDGVVVAGADGTAVVKLPRWFETLNGEFRYQLTPIGSSAPNLHVAKEIEEGQFTIGGGVAGMKISWQVTGIRQDAWAKANRVVVEEDKKLEEHGRYLHPHLHGQSKEMDIGARRHRTGS
jgi:hypothetical protein